jgi:hypothetical protein
MAIITLNRAALALTLCALAACGWSGSESTPNATSSAANANSSSSSGSSSGSNATPAIPSAPKTIAGIQIVGAPIKVFDHTTDQQQPNNYPDAQVTAWREADGTVDLLIPHSESYRMRGPDLEHLSMDVNEIYSSTLSASQIPETLYNYHHWMMGPYSLDGMTFYTLTHSEWYACLLNNNCNAVAPGGSSAQLNSWANTLNSLTSADGGASWQLNIVAGNHVVARTAYTWTGSEALSQQIYLHALNHTGMFGPSRVIMEGVYFYSIAYYIHRDFTQINPAAGIYEAPIDKSGYVILRSNDLADPNSWQAWTSGSTYEPIANMDFGVFEPQQGGSSANAGSPQIIYDTNARCFIFTYAVYQGGGAVYYMTSKSLASPSWSAATAIVGTAALTTDPAGPVVGFTADNYPSTLDDSSSGFNYEFTDGSPQLFFSTFPGIYGGNNLARDLYRIQLSITYQ